MLTFANDYSEGVHPKLLQRLIETNEEILTGYGEDKYTQRAVKKIKNACNALEANVYFFVGGTQANMTLIDALLDKGKGVITADCGHINTHEAGTIEFIGHKIITIKNNYGKLSAINLTQYLENFHADSNNTQMVFPGLVYLSHPTEYGTLYSKNELSEISEVCKEHHLQLYLDGARLAYALASPDNDLALADINILCDAFYLGGTKVGAFCGEAAIVPQNITSHRFSTFMKQHGALVAKGRLLGVQFDALFTDNLYERIGDNAIKCAQKITQIFSTNGYEFFLPPQTNQIFIVLETGLSKKLSEEVDFRFWHKLGDKHIVARFVTSWATKLSDVDKLEKILEKYKNQVY